VAFVAGRRLGGAVARNRARRLLREAWRAVEQGPSPGSDVVLVARPGIERARTQDVVTDIGDLLRRLEGSARA
jgi:ribonuclease P protein component